MHSWPQIIQNCPNPKCMIKYEMVRNSLQFSTNFAYIFFLPHRELLSKEVNRWFQFNSIFSMNVKCSRRCCVVLFAQHVRWVFGACCVDILIMLDILQMCRRKKAFGRACFFFLCASFLPKSFSQYKCKFPLYRKKSGRIEFRYNSIYSRNLIPLGLRLTEVVLIFAKASTMIKVNYWHMQTCYRRFSSCSSVLCMCAYAFSFIQFNLHFICVSIYPLALNRMHFLLLAHK